MRSVGLPNHSHECKVSTCAFEFPQPIPQHNSLFPVRARASSRHSRNMAVKTKTKRTGKPSSFSRLTPALRVAIFYLSWSGMNLNDICSTIVKPDGGSPSVQTVADTVQYGAANGGRRWDGSTCGSTTFSKGNTKRNMVCTYKREVLAQMSFFLRLERDKYFGTLRINGRYLRKCTFYLGGE